MQSTESLTHKCNKCGKVKPLTEFYKRKDRTTLYSVCKECKRKVNNIDPERFTLIADLLIKRKRADTAVLLLRDYTQRLLIKEKSFDELPYIGLRAILKEMERPYDFCFAEQINNYEFVLVPITSVYDIENLIYNLEVFGPEKRTAKIVIGGPGVHNIKIAVDYIDIAVWGRAEGQINLILNGFAFPNVWRKSDDPLIEGTYRFGRFRYLVLGETTCGCIMRCYYCQYSWTRQTNQHYSPMGFKHQEDFGPFLNITKPGMYISAIDGLTEETRHKVNRPLKDKQITDKITQALDTIVGGVTLICNSIIGFPWENPDTVLHDINQLIHLISTVDRQSDCRLFIQLKMNPFSAEVCTPLQYEKPSCNYNYTEHIKPGNLYQGKSIRISILPGLTSSYAVIKRMLINRYNYDIDYKGIMFNKQIIKSSKYAVSKLILDTIPTRYYDKVGRGGFEYLEDSTEIPIYDNK